MAESAIRVLLVEDDEEDYILTKHMMSEARHVRFDVTWADRLESALNHLNSSTVDVVLLDLSLPDSEGWETFTSVRKQSPDLPVVLLTGMEDEDLGAKAVYEGAQDYLVKNELSTQLLTRSISYAIERRRAQDALRTAYNELESLIRQRTRELANTNQRLSIETARRERAERALKEGRRLEAICAFVDGMAHSFNDITHRITAGIERIRESSGLEEEHAGTCDRIATETDSAHDISSRLMGLANAAGLVATHVEPLSMREIIQGALGESAEILRKAGIDTSLTDDTSGTVVSADKNQLSDVILHCLRNASNIMRDGGYVSLSIKDQEVAVPPENAAPDAQGGRYVTVEIKYEDTVLNAEAMDALLNPITGTGEEEAFSGLGLAVVENRARGWGGWLQMTGPESAHDGFRILVPVSREHVEKKEQSASALLGGRTVLVVDDDQAMLNVSKRFLEGAGYTVAVADSVERALSIIADMDEVGIAIVDAVMPGSSSEDVLVQVRKAHPGAMPLVISGFSRDYVQGVMSSSDWKFLQKPFDEETFLNAIESLVRGHVSYVTR